jgi:hypothetical protein
MTSRYMRTEERDFVLYCGVGSATLYDACVLLIALVTTAILP